MPSTDIDGSVIVILSKDEAECVYRRLEIVSQLNEVEQHLLQKIKRDLGI